MDDPLLVNDFVRFIIEEKRGAVIGVAVSKPGQLKTKKARVDLRYAMSLLIIAGFVESFKQSMEASKFRVKKYLSKIFERVKSPSIIQFAKDRGIPAWEVNSINDPKFLEILKELEPDIVINQAQEIIGEKFLSIPRLGVVNRHNSLLPKYRGRLAPFWALYNKEKETGVTIHFITEAIDEGEIIVQRKIEIIDDDNYVTITKKCYEVAAEAMIEAIELLENKKDFKGIKISSEMGSYYSCPRIRDAIKFRFK